MVVAVTGEYPSDAPCLCQLPGKIGDDVGLSAKPDCSASGNSTPEPQINPPQTPGSAIVRQQNIDLLGVSEAVAFLLPFHCR